MRAPLVELVRVILATWMEDTMSTSEGYWPSEPMLMPWEPLQERDWIRTEEAFGLSDTQSE